MNRLGLVILASVISFTAVAEPVYTIGRAPQLSAVATSKAWTPFIEYLNQHTAFQFKLQVYQDRGEFENDLLHGGPDFYYGNPGYLIVGKKTHGYQGLLRSDKKQLKGIIVVKADSDVQNIEQLRNKDLVFPGKNAFAASLYIRSLLKKSLKMPFKENYVSGHDNVYRAVLLGRYIAGGGVYRTLDREPEALKNKLKVIYETPGMAPHPLAVHPRVPKKVSLALLETVLAMPSDPAGKQILDKIKLKNPIAVDFARDYASIEDLALEMYSGLLR